MLEFKFDRANGVKMNTLCKKFLIKIVNYLK